jgi:hypothetical protein
MHVEGCMFCDGAPCRLAYLETSALPRLAIQIRSFKVNRRPQLTAPTILAAHQCIIIINNPKYASFHCISLVLDKGKPGVSMRRSLVDLFLQTSFRVTFPKSASHVCDIQAVPLAIIFEANAFA